jgi:pilus assembly protein CpaB
MRLMFGLVLLVGIALAGGAVMMARNYISAYQAELANERAARAEVVPTVEVFVANGPLRYGETLTQDSVRKVRWPQDSVPEGAFMEEAVLFPDPTRPRFVLRAMEKDEAIMAIKVTEPGEDAGLTSRLEKGMRAFAIRVDVASGVSGFLRPGDRVDVYWTGRVETNGNQSGEVTKLIESAVSLIAVDQSAGGDLDGAVIARTVTVAVAPQQVAKLAQAQSTGNLSLALVGTEDDTAVTDRIEVDQRSLLGLAEAVIQAEPEREKVCTIRTRKGADVVEIAIPCTN